MAFHLVTGGAGFIGSALVRRLLERGDRVRVVDDFSTGLHGNLEGIWDRIELIEGDLAEPPVAERAVKGAEIILHQAAIPSVPRSVADPVRSHRANVTATVNLLTAARDAGVKRFVYASSSSVYGDSPTLPKSETLPENPISPYAATKLAAEKYCVVFHRTYGLSTVSLRYFNVFGPRQNPDSPYSAAISRFIAAALDGMAPTVYGDGEQTRDFTYVDNVVSANLLAASAKGVDGMVFNIGTGERHSVNALLGLLSTIVNRQVKPAFGAPRKGEVRDSQAAIDQARRMLGYEPTVNFEEGLRRTVAWFQEVRR